MRIGEDLKNVPLPQFSGRWITIAPPGSATTIALVPAHEDVPAGVQTGIRLASPDAAAGHQQLHDRGVHVENCCAGREFLGCS